jgi:hypothetical protein
LISEIVKYSKKTKILNYLKEIILSGLKKTIKLERLAER